MTGAAPPAAAGDPPHAAWAQVGWQVDADETVAVLQGGGIDWLVVDHYAFDARWHDAVRARLGAKLAAIDDLADRALRVDLLVDHNLAADHRAKYRAVLPEGTPILGGPRHALLGPAFVHAAPYTFHDPVHSIGIFMGGADSRDLSSAVLRACRLGAGFGGPVEVVTTASHPNLAALRALAAQWPATTVSVDLPDLAAFFARHDLQIGAGGGATWERCRVGAPSLVLVTADNQRAVAPALAASNAVATLGDGATLSEQGIAEAVAKLLRDADRRRALADGSRTVVDGLGARRVALRMTATTLAVRAVRMTDGEAMHRWRNHPATRVVSNDARPIELEAHRDWLRQALGDERRCLLLGHVGRIDVGVIRFDLHPGGEAEVSLYLDPTLPGLGLGAALLRAGERHLRALRRGDCVTLVATVLEGNTASRRLFAAAGYTFAGGFWRKPLGHETTDKTAEMVKP